MKKLNLMCLGLVAGATLAGCSEDALLPDNTKNEQYVRDFIERFGIPDPDHTFSMAKRNSITVKSSTPVDVQIFGIYGGKEYIFADWKGVSGTQVIPFDIPSSVTELAVVAGDKIRYAEIGGVVNFDGPDHAKSRALPDGLNKNGIIVSYPSTHTLSPNDYLKPYKEGQVYYGAIHPTLSSISWNFYDNENHPNKDANGSKVHYWNDHNNRLPATIMKQFVGTTPEFYNDEKFKKCDPVVLTTEGLVPSLYIHHVRKSLNYEMGIIVGSSYTLGASRRCYCIPMLTSEGLDEIGRNQILKLAQTSYDETKQLGQSIRFYFNKETDNVSYGDDKYWTWDFSENGNFYGIKEDIEKLAELYTVTNNKRPLPLPIDLADLDNVNSNYPNKDKLIAYEDNKAGNEFYLSYQDYLEWSLANLDAENKAKYNELFYLKEWFGNRREFLMSREDIPVVRRINDGEGNPIPGGYIVSFPVAKKANGFAAIEANEGTDDLYTKMDDPYTVYRVMDFGVALHSNLWKHQYAWYIKDLDKKEGDDGYIITTADPNVKLKKMSPKMTGLEKGYDYGEVVCWDVNGDGIYNDIVFNWQWTGSAGHTPKDPFTWILACEDLGGIGDYDFNDLVVGVKYVSSNNDKEQPVEFYPLAAGGIYPIYLMYNEKYKNDLGEDIVRTYIVGKELHEWLGGSNKDGEELAFIKTEESVFPHAKLLDYRHQVQFKYQSGFANNSFADLMGDVKQNQSQNQDDNQSFVGFWVLVDKDNDVANHYATWTDAEGNKFELVQGMNEIKDMADFNNATKNCQKVVSAAASRSANPVPMMMVLGSDWEWPMEMNDISKVYPKWTEWLKDKSTYWYGEHPETSEYSSGADREMVVKRPDITNAINGTAE